MKPSIANTSAALFALLIAVAPPMHVDAQEHLYIGVQSGVEVYPIGARHDASPERILDFFLRSTEIAVDANGEVFAGGLQFPDLPPAVVVYAAKAFGHARPLRMIVGSKTTLRNPGGIAVDAAGYIYVSDIKTSQINVFAPGANGNVSPARIIAGPATLLNNVDGYIAVDSVGDLFVEQGGFFLDSLPTSSPTNDVLEFAPNANGNVAPIGMVTLHRGEIENVSVQGHQLYVTANVYGSYGHAFVEIYTLPRLKRIQELDFHRWFDAFGVGAAATSRGDLLVAALRAEGGVWSFAPSHKLHGGVMETPDGFLGGLHTYIWGSSDLRIGP